MADLFAAELDDVGLEMKPHCFGALAAVRSFVPRRQGSRH